MLVCLMLLHLELFRRERLLEKQCMDFQQRRSMGEKTAISQTHAGASTFAGGVEETWRS